ncbi:MAG TPA: hypothetical protein VN026_18140 [Bacteroidia bacterium]|jgi:hypothetical protein|nr:hypothetical protein [Bacteroidia bacterium]
MTSKSYPNRSETFILDFVNDVEIVSTWKALTDTCKIIIPKNVYVQTPTGNVAWADLDLYVNTDQAPVFLRGDKVTVELGYEYDPGDGNYIVQTNQEFSGYITKVNPKIPIEIECEDNMWLLKQAQCPNKVFPMKDWNTTTIIQYLLKNATVNSDNPFLTNVIIPTLATFNVTDGTTASQGVNNSVTDFRTQNETIAQVLQRLKKDYLLECFFRGNTLFVTAIVYYPVDFYIGGAISSTVYDFEKNIVKNDMIYQRKDDIRLGIKAHCQNIMHPGTVNSAGKQKTKKVRLEASVGDPDGEIRTMNFIDSPNDPIKDVKTLEAHALPFLTKLKIEGWKGNFTSFGLPIVRHGEAITLSSEITPERIGTYLVKKTTVKFNEQGFRRINEPHIRIGGTFGLKPADFINGL